MTEQQHHPQPSQRVTGPGVDAEDASARGLEDLDGGAVDTEHEELDRAWVKFSQARASLAEVMSDDELRAFGFNVEALDERL